MITASQATPTTAVERNNSSVQAADTWPAHRLGAHGLNVEHQILVVQWALPLVLASIVFAYEISKHLELAEAQQRLNTLHAQRGDLVNRLMSVQKAERRRLAREIHDELGQLLTGLSLNLRLCQEAVPDNLPTAHDRLTKASSVVRHTIEQSHRLIADLHPTVLDDYGLVPALEEELGQRLTPLGIESRLGTEGDLKHLPADVSTAAFRIVQEAITNVIRHANARRVQVRLQQATDGLTVTIEGDGVGILENGLRSRNGRSTLGILGMQERARALGGRLSVMPCDPRGTRIHLRLPLQTDET